MWVYGYVGMWVCGYVEGKNVLQSPPLAGARNTLNYKLLTMGVENSPRDNRVIDRLQIFHPYAVFAYVKIVIYPRQRGRLRLLSTDFGNCNRTIVIQNSKFRI